ncbi:alpha/beta fold hydrolase [Fodinicola acaciae]|uniref:alpha/beta fold hydrolase n=1 Tax=Fodinicola acaciae TaxID=2681555 RepID=UPI0013CFCB7D|nr:alpha/beta hydrolase [Fodinicola acaciae]
MPKVIANGLETNFQAIPGEPGGELVVFLHGLGTDSLASFHLTLASPVSAAGIGVLSYDLRGHGRTTRPPTGYRLSDFVADLDELLDQLRIEQPVHLVGNSFGGTLAYSYAHTHPERVRSIVSIESEPPTRMWAGRMREVLTNTAGFLALEDSYEWLEATFGAHHRRLARMAAERIGSTSMVTEIPTGPLMTVEQVRSIGCPVLSILGHDGYQAEDLQAVTSMLPRGELVVIPDQGHSVLVERHRMVRDLLVGWVRKCARRGVARR